MDLNLGFLTSAEKLSMGAACYTYANSFEVLKCTMYSYCLLHFCCRLLFCFESVECPEGWSFFCSCCG